MRAAIRSHRQLGETQPGLLHNMSVPPKTVVSYSGLGGLVDAAGFDGIQPRRAGKGNPATYGYHLRFALAETVPKHDPALLMQTLGIDSAVDPMSTLERLIEARARELPLPDACLVVRAEATHTCRFPDVMSALAVLTKCSDHVWLRAKRPNLSRLSAHREVSLLLPPQHCGRFQEIRFP